MPKATRPGIGGLQLDWNATPRQGVWLTGAGTLIFNFSADGQPEKPPVVVPFLGAPHEEGMGLISSLLPTPVEEGPRSVALTSYHVLLLLRDQIHILSRITFEKISTLALHQSMVPKKLIYDSVGERVYLTTDQRVYEVGVISIFINKKTKNTR